jgi:hypothetical protein
VISPPPTLTAPEDHMLADTPPLPAPEDQTPPDAPPLAVTLLTLHEKDDAVLMAPVPITMIEPFELVDVVQDNVGTALMLIADPVAMTGPGTEAVMLKPASAD